jgi:ketosteroid isomerase-like protein
MSRNTETVETYLGGFRRNDHAQILSCLTDDIEWTVFGAFHLIGKQAYDDAIEGPGFTGPPRLDVVRMAEQDDVVMAELTGEVTRDSGASCGCPWRRCSSCARAGLPSGAPGSSS